MNSRPQPQPPQDVVRDEGELAVWHAAFGAAYAQSILLYAAKVRTRLRPANCTHRQAVEMALVENGPAPIEAQLIAEAAVLKYRELVGK